MSGANARLMKNPKKIAIVYDWLVSWGGGERVLRHVFNLYPRSTIHVLVSDPGMIQGTEFQKARIINSRLQYFPLARRYYRQYLAFYPWAVQGFDLSGYDLILSISHAAAKGVRVCPGQTHLCYCFTPMRYAWDLRDQYMSSLDPVRRTVAGLILNHLKSWDFESSKRVSAFAGISHFISNRIYRAYDRQARIIYPGVEVGRFVESAEKGKYFLTVSRFVPYKKIDLIVEAFSEMGLPLKVIGDGPERSRILKKAGPTVEFLGALGDAEVAHFMQGARAFVFAALEDFGIAPVEALACGTPVIGFGVGGLAETVRDGLDGVYFMEQTAPSLKSAVEKFMSMERKFDFRVLRQRAEEFSVPRFHREFKEFVDSNIRSNPGLA